MIIRTGRWLLLCLILTLPATLRAADDPFAQAAANAELALEGFIRCQRFVDGWLTHLVDEKTGLIYRNATQKLWLPHDNAADNWPFMVLTAALLDRPRYDGQMLEMLRTEERLTSRMGALADHYSLEKHAFIHAEPQIDRIMFSSAEYIKDGLLPLSEYLGPSPFQDRLFAILDDMWKRAAVETPHGRITSENLEVQGDQLQALCRAYWMTGQRRYLDYAVRIGDLHLLGQRHPTRDAEVLPLRDHGCEFISGLCELYFALHHADPAKKKLYQKPLREMLDRILEVGRNEHGLFYNRVNPRTGQVLDRRLSDNFGYNLNGFYTVHLVDDVPAYRDAVRKALENLDRHYRNHNWEGNDSADGHADAIEGALNLYNREVVESAAAWIDHDMQVMWRKQKENGIIEGWHGDGNFARTTLMYCLWKTQGLTVREWNPGLRVGAHRAGDTLYILLNSDREWSGRLRFDAPRHRHHMHMPADYPRINQFPEWFTVTPGSEYVVRDVATGTEARHAGASLIEPGLPVEVKARAEVRLTVRPMRR